ncbi:uncharacterized protein LOC135108951 [Scylla paramamosain]|uniref:uncharacterized protein LOC135108951 n=1 Tax=Scylla paramamosain TaxID=85552 RepID=UPI003082EF0C
MNEEVFSEIVDRVRSFNEKSRTFWREPLDPGLRVAITLRFLATGNSYKSLGFAFGVGPSTISLVVPETCRAIVAAYGDEVMQVPDTTKGWKEVARGFHERWNFPHTLGAIDGKHIRIKNPDFSGSHYHNYKKFSVVLLAVVDSDYKFLFIDVGAIRSWEVVPASRLRLYNELGDINRRRLRHRPLRHPEGTWSVLQD